MSNAQPAARSEAQVPESTDPVGTPASWVIRNKKTGAAVMETFNPEIVKRINEAKYEAVPILQHLHEINLAIKAQKDDLEQAASQALSEARPRMR